MVKTKYLLILLFAASYQIIRPMSESTWDDEFLIDESEDTEQVKYLHKWFSAARDGNLEKIKELIDKVDINAQDSWGWTALTMAAADGYKDILEFLLNRPGINVNIQQSHGNTALLLATVRKTKNIIKILLKTPGINVLLPNNTGQVAFFEIINLGDPQLVDLLLKVPGIDINGHYNNGHTPLMLSAIRAHESVVKLLLQQQKININAQDSHGITALIHAAYLGHANIVKLLLEVPNININMKDKTGKTALMWATEQKHKATAAIIQEQIDRLTCRAFEAVKTDNLNLLRTITGQIGIDHIFDSDKNTLLDKAFAVNSLQIIFFLLQHAEDPQELLARFPFEAISPSSELFEYFIKLAYGELNGRVPSINNESDQHKMREKSCALCLQEHCQLLCGRCKKVYYCSSKCQKSDWRFHKSRCKKTARLDIN